jgi:hypothetical protein
MAARLALVAAQQHGRVGQLHHHWRHLHGAHALGEPAAGP